MNEKLQQAILAARNEQKTEAQILLTQVLKEDPNETQAWFLLSTLVDSESKKIAYLGKVLALEPEHQMAQKMLARLQGGAEAEAEAEIEREKETVTEEAVTGIEAGASGEPAAPVVVSYNTADFLAQQKGDTLPEWLIEEEGMAVTEESVMAQAESAQETILDEAAGIPDWLQDEVPESWSEETPAAEAISAVSDLPEKKTKIASATTPESKSVVNADKKKQQAFLTGILYTLIAVTVVIFFIMIYLAWNTFF